MSGSFDQVVCRIAATCIVQALLVWWPSAAGADAVVTWNENAARAATVACLLSGTDLAESRMYVVVLAAIRDAATVSLCVTSLTFLTLSSRSQTDSQ
jgi:ABC-type Co2+ transport system permease subunit